METKKNDWIEIVFDLIIFIVVLKITLSDKI